MQQYTTPSDRPAGQRTSGIQLDEFTKYLHEIQNQPAWRGRADKEMDYVDGNQLDAEVLQRQAALGMPPAIEPLIGPAIEAVLGLEAKTRTDWRVRPEDDEECDDDLAEALSLKLKHAEIESRADRAVSDAYAAQCKAGLGWVEVAREHDPFKCPYRVKLRDVEIFQRGTKDKWEQPG